MLARENIDRYEAEVELVRGDVALLYMEGNVLMEEGREEPLVVFEDGVDVVVMNPPFGTRRKGIDIVFLEKATQVWYVRLALIC